MNAREQTSIFLPAGQVLTLTPASDCVGSIYRTRNPIGGEPYTPVAIGAVVLAFGPFAEGRYYHVNCDKGSLTFDMATVDPETYTRTTDFDAAIATLEARHLYGEGAPVDYTDGTPPATGEGVSEKGFLYSDITGGLVYRNSGTKAQPIWTRLGDYVP